MSRFESIRSVGRRLRVTDLHPHLMCILCGGYYVDATTIIECLHSFCKSCLVKYLESNKYCPICEVQVHKSKPLLNIRSDETLQSMVYKLVPGLFHREMRLRQEFYDQHPDAPESSLEDRGIIDPIECQFYSPDELVSLALEFKTDLLSSSSSNCAHKRYLRCPAAVTIAHLQKLVRNKYSLPTSFNVDIMFDDKLLTSDFSIMDVAYTFQRKRKEQFHFTYRIVETPCKKRKLEESMEELQVVEPMEVDSAAPALTPADSTPPVKTTGSSLQESKSKLDSIISRLGVAKQTENGVKKDKTGDEWKEVHLQISENGVMSVTDISPIDKLINSIEKNAPCAPKEKEAMLNQKVHPPNEKSSSVKPKVAVDSQIPGKEKDPPLVETSVKKDEKPVSNKTCVKSDHISGHNETVKNELSVLDVAAVRPQLEVKKEKPSIDTRKDRPMINTKKEEEKKTTLDAQKSTSASPCTTTFPPSKAPGSSSTVHVTVPPKVSAPSSSASSSPGAFKPNVAQAGAPSGTPPQLCVTLGSSQVTLSLSPSPSVTPNSSASSATKATSVTSAASAALTTTTVVRAAPVPAAKPMQVTPVAKKSSSSPVGYKTLKCGPKNWNPSISRNSFLSSKAEQQPQQQGSSSSTPAGQGKSATPPRFFKMRNTPRYLGNPASGVKAMYQVPDVKSETPAPAKSPSVMKLDPRTLTPIVSNASSPTSKSTPTQPKGRPPFPSTTLSAQISNSHMPSSRSVTATTTSSSAAKLPDLSSLRSSSTQPMVNPFLPNPFMKGMTSLLYGPGLIPPGVPFPNMLRPGLGYPPVTASGFHATLPQTASMLFNPHPLHRQISSPSPGSPTGYPPSLPTSPSMSLSPSSSSSSSSSLSSKSYPSNQRMSNNIEKSNNLNAQLSPSHSDRSSVTSSSTGRQEPIKVNGSETKAMSLNQEKHSQEPKSDPTKTKAHSPVSKDVKASTQSPSANNNNNNLSISKAKSPSENLDGVKLSLEVSNLLPKDSGKREGNQPVARSKDPSST